MRRQLAALPLLLSLAPAASGFELLGAIGLDDLRNDPAPNLGIEARTAPIAEFRWLDVALGAAAEADGDTWFGAGPVLLIPVSDRWRMEASVMLGAHSSHGGNDLGSDFPMFRSQLGASYDMGRGWRAGISVNHKSNASTAVRNPGVEALMLSIGREF